MDKNHSENARTANKRFGATAAVTPQKSEPVFQKNANECNTLFNLYIML